MPTILTKKKDTAGAPAPGDLTNSAGGAELAVNTFDKRLYTKNAGGSVVEIGTNPSTIDTTTVDTTNLEVTNIKAKDGTASATIADSTGIFTHSTATVFPAGTVSAPSITTAGDTNTGIYFPAADTIAFTEGGVEGMRLNSAGNVGIGTSTLAARLTINGGAGTAQTRFEVNTTEVQEVATNAAQNAYANRLADAAQHVWKISSTEAMRLNSSGNLGIGTTSPAARLETNVASGGNEFRMNIAGSVSAQLISTTTDFIFVNNRTGAQIFNTNGSERMRIDSNGNIGVGTTNPFARLAVVANSYTPSSSAWATSAAFAGAGAFGGGLSFIDGSAGYTMFIQDAGGTFGIGQGATSGGVTTRILISSIGNVGIGTTGPAVRLDVVGPGGGATQLRIGDGAQQGRMSFSSSGSYGIAAGADWGGMLFFSNNATQRMTIDTNGLVGIGGSPAFQLHVISTQEWPVALRTASNTTTHRALYLTQRANGTVASPSAVTSGSILGGMAMGGYNSSTYTLGYNGGAEIQAVAEATWTTISNPTSLAFFTTPTGGSSVTERMRIYGSGIVAVGDTGVVNTSAALSVGSSLGLATGNPWTNNQVTITSSAAMAAGVGGLLNLEGSFITGTPGGSTFAWIKGAKTNATSTDATGDLILGARNGNIRFTNDATNSGLSTERMRMNTSGDFIINGTTPKQASKFTVYGNTAQMAVYTGSFTGGWQNVVNIDSVFSGSCGRIRAYGNENGNNNVSYGEWFYTTSSIGPQISAQGQVAVGNGLGTVQLRMSGATLQIQNGNGSAIGAWQVSFELFQGF